VTLFHARDLTHVRLAVRIYFGAEHAHRLAWSAIGREPSDERL
jgi:hypothetical protein